MEAKTNILGLVDWLFGSEGETDVEKDPDPEEERPYPIEIEPATVEYEDMAFGSFERTVELIEFVGSGPMLVEYDREERRGSEIVFFGFTGSGTGARYGHRSYIDPQHNEELIRINESNILHRRELGSYTVELSQAIELVQHFKQVVDPESIPDECKRYDGVPVAYTYDREGNYVVREDGRQFSGAYGHAFERIQFPWWDEPRIVYDRNTNVENTIGDVEIEHTKSTAEIVAEAIETGTNVVQAVLADGRTVVTDDVQGLDDESSDLMRIADLSSEDN